MKDLKMKEERVNILIIEDNPDDISIMKRQLAKYHLHMDFATSGEEGLEKLKGKSYDIVVADYAMPGMTGLDVLDKMKQDGYDIPLVMVTSAGSPKIAVEAMKKGAYDYLVKSLDPGWLEMFPSVIHNSVEKYRMIKEKERTEKEKKELETRLQQAQKMEAIGTLAGGIAHDFNNLLMGIQGNVSLMLLDIDSTHPHYERLKNVEKQTQRGAKLTGELLGYARKGRYEIKPVDLNQLVEETSETFGRTRKEVVIHRDLAEDSLAIEADEGQIEQVLLNLYINAADAMPGGGDLILKTINVTHKHIKGKLYDPNPGNYVLLTVSDEGMGMSKETMERIFEPFFTTKETGRGTGLGLASVYGIIRGHGGYVDVGSKKGQGSTFSIYLPATKKKVRKPAKTHKEFIQGTGTLLLVDDEEVILEVGQSLLEAVGYRVFTAMNGQEAIEVYKKNRDAIDIVLLDMVMPIMGGGELYDRLKEINPDIKVILSSGYSIDGQATEILRRGCDGFIQKPFKVSDLYAKIEEILRKE
jgi:two-component system cell cycle sensor histidine kinase/response regulator CckA